MALFRGLEVVEAMGQQLSGGGNAKERWRSIPFGQNAISNGTERTRWNSWNAKSRTPPSSQLFSTKRDGINLVAP